MASFTVMAALAGRSATKRVCRTANLIGRFAHDRSANVALMFALMVVPLVSTVGLAVDFGRVYFVRSQTQSALDAAALAAGRVAQVETTDKMNKASAAASAFFNQAASKDVVSSILQFSPNSEQTSFTLSAKSWVRTPFLGVLNSCAASVATTSDGLPDKAKRLVRS